MKIVDTGNSKSRIEFPALEETLRGADLRPTRQRVALAELLYGKGDRHVTAEMLFSEAQCAGIPVSQATIYNALHQFEAAGLLRIVNVGSSKTYFDTNVIDHHHYFIEGSNDLVDMPSESIRVDYLPEPPEGMEISKIDVVVRLKKTAV